jgi:hypothetical protein
MPETPLPDKVKREVQTIRNIFVLSPVGIHLGKDNERGRSLPETVFNSLIEALLPATYAVVKELMEDDKAINKKHRIGFNTLISFLAPFADVLVNVNAILHGDWFMKYFYNVVTTNISHNNISTERPQNESTTDIKNPESNGHH